MLCCMFIFVFPSSGNWILKEIMVSGDSQCVFSAHFATHDSWQIWTWYCWKTTSALGDLIFHYSASFTDKIFSGMRSLQKFLFFSLFPLSLYIVLRHCVKMRPCTSTRGSISLDYWFIIIISKVIITVQHPVWYAELKDFFGLQSDTSTMLLFPSL